MSYHFQAKGLSAVTPGQSSLLSHFTTLLSSYSNRPKAKCFLDSLTLLPLYLWKSNRRPPHRQATIALMAIHRLGLCTIPIRLLWFMITPVIPHYLSQPAVTSTPPDHLYRVTMHWGGGDVVLGSDWVSTTGSVFCGGGFGPLDPPVSHYIATGGLPLDSQ